MPNVREVKKLVSERGVINLVIIQDEWGVDINEAYRILKACLDRGLLLPVDRAYFAFPDEEGLPIQYGSSAGRRNREQWWQKELDVIRPMLEEEDAALTITDVVAVADLNRERVRKTFELLVELGECVKFEAAFGGAFGRKPYIYTKNPENVASRNTKLRIEAKERREARTAKSKATRDKKRKTNRAAEREEWHTPHPIHDDNPPLKVDFDEA